MNSGPSETQKANKLNDDLTSFWSLVWLLTARLFTSITSLYFLIIPLVFILAFAFVFPLPMVMSFTFTFSILCSSFFLYGLFFFNIRKSTLYYMISLQLSTKKGKVYIYGALFLVMLLFNLIFAFFILFIIWILSFFVISDAFPYPIGEPRFNGQHYIEGWYLFDLNFGITTITLQIFLYFIIFTTILCFAIALFFQGITTSLRGYMIISTTYILLTTIFGAVIASGIMPLFCGEYYLTDNFLSDPYFIIDVAKINSFSIDSDGVYHIELYLQPIELVKTVDTDGGELWVYDTKTFADYVKEPLWWISQFIPQFFLNSTFYSSSLTLSYTSTSSEGINKSALYFGDLNHPINEAVISTKFFAFDNVVYTYYFIMPYIWILFYLIIGGIVNDKN